MNSCNIFEILKIERKEMIHSAMIVAIASYNSECRNLFFKMLRKKYEEESDLNKNKKLIENLDALEKSIIRKDYKGWINTEHLLKEMVGNEERLRGRADIWIGNNENPSYRLIIENKIDAIDQEYQLRRYFRYLIGNGRNNAGLFYLCLKEDKEKSKWVNNYSAKKYEHESINADVNTDWHLLTYEKDIKNWLEQIASLELNCDFKWAVEQYIKIVNSILKE
ncbi:PD-(D/E)XK nuclease family protein [Phocaeicola barnesiae]|uniref:PD-(D/E)XK nuclease family protein n=1 Tax=Phocaeicola barnesiae TaxID=376804 RepID=UPI002430E88B|nr:PD-(D/E)XK nuclease family protein [Phocaeicola barnesiae]